MQARDVWMNRRAAQASKDDSRVESTGERVQDRVVGRRPGIDAFLGRLPERRQCVLVRIDPPLATDITWIPEGALTHEAAPHLHALAGQNLRELLERAGSDLQLARMDECRQVLPVHGERG